MRFSAACLVLAATSASAAATPAIQVPQQGLRASSPIGRHLMSQARRVEDAGAEEEQAWQMDLSWVNDYSLKFQGCNYVQQVRI